MFLVCSLFKSWMVILRIVLCIVGDIFQWNNIKYMFYFLFNKQTNYVENWSSHKGNGVIIEINANLVWLIPCINDSPVCADLVGEVASSCRQSSRVVFVEWDVVCVKVKNYIYLTLCVNVIQNFIVIIHYDVHYWNQWGRRSYFACLPISTRDF